MAINQAKAKRFQKKSTHDLERIRDSGSLSAAAAEYELLRRKRALNKS